MILDGKVQIALWLGSRLGSAPGCKHLIKIRYISFLRTTFFEKYSGERFRRQLEILEVSKRYANKRDLFEDFDNEIEAITALSSRSIPLYILGIPISSQERSDQEGRCNDYWCIENDGKELIRYRSQPRRTRFCPEAVRAIPVEISNLEQTRKIIGE